ncbi:MAG: hypothetical protein IJZ09_06035, partial [Tidjanibacter sp.]|nr:hypothetical protein [Tidjanibacter sp.]
QGLQGLQGVLPTIPVIPVILVTLVTLAKKERAPQFTLLQRTQIVRRVVGAQENHLRSLLIVNEEVVYRSATT